MGLISGTVGRLYSHGTAETAFTLEACSLLSGTNYQIDDADKRWWRPESGITVSTANASSTVLVSSALYSRRDLGGVIEFISAPAGSVLVTGTCYAMSQVGGFKEWEVTVARTALETSRQGTGPWKTNVNGLAEFTMSADGFWLDDYFLDTVDGNVKWLVSAYMDIDAGQRYDAETFLTKDSVSTEVSGLAEESVEFVCTAKPEYYAS